MNQRDLFKEVEMDLLVYVLVFAVLAFAYGVVGSVLQAYLGQRIAGVRYGPYTLGSWILLALILFFVAGLAPLIVTPVVWAGTRAGRPLVLRLELDEE